MSKQGPKYKITLKNKSNSTFRGVAAVWQNEHGLNFTLDRDIEEIRYKDGTIVTPASLGKDGAFYGNVYAQDTQSKPRAKSADDDEMPF